MSMITTCLKSVFLETTNYLSFCKRAYRSYVACNYSYSVPEFHLGFPFPFLLVSVFCPFPGKFPFPVLPRANPISKSIVAGTMTMHIIKKKRKKSKLTS